MFSVFLQTILPHHLLSRIMLRFLRIRWSWLKNLQIRFVIRQFKVDMTQVEQPDIKSYEHFNAFFTRAMKTDPNSGAAFLNAARIAKAYGDKESMKKYLARAKALGAKIPSKKKKKA